MSVESRPNDNPGQEDTVSAGQVEPPVTGVGPQHTLGHDFTYVPTRKRFAYVAVVIDAYAQKIVG
jgi:transposase InsO family protein